jgi:endoglycosylceramidase
LTDGLANPDVGFPNYYVSNPALQRAFDNFWANEEGPDGVPLQQHYGEALRAVAKLVRDEPYVIGYDLMNEPWPGTDWTTCLSPGCPDIETARLIPFEQRMTEAIRTVDRKHLVFSEPFTLFNFGLSNTVVPAVTTPNRALSFHVYAVSPTDETAVVLRALVAGVARGAPPLATEFGASSDPAEITRIASTIEHGLVPWAFWSYDENLVIDKGQPPVDGNVRIPALDALARPYAATTAGTPASWDYDASSHALKYTYTPDWRRGKDTSVVLGSRAYPNGYAVSVTGARVVSKPCAGTLRLRTSHHATAVTVEVTPATNC